MENKYLLVATYAWHDMGDSIGVNTMTLGFFDSINEAFVEAEKDLEEEAYNVALSFCDEDDEDEIENFVADYLRDFKATFKVEDEDFKGIGDTKFILDHKYDSDDETWSHCNSYAVIKIK